MFNPYQSMNPVPMAQTNYIPFVYVNGIEGAKAYIVAPNQTVYLKDSDSNMLYEKKADSLGKFYIKAYEMKEVEQPSQIEPTSDIIEFKQVFNEKMDKLSTLIEKLVQKEGNNE